MSENKLLRMISELKGGLRLYKIDEVPEYQRSNPFILTGYRAKINVLACVKSILAVHNETGNIW